MAIDFERKVVPGKTPAFWRGEAKILPGGFSLVQTFPVGTIFYRGAFVAVNFDNMSAAVVKIAKVLTGGSTAKPRVAKGHYLQIGDTVMKLGVTDKTPMVKAIDRTNSGYDIIELSAALTELSENDMIQEATDYVAPEGENPAVPAAPKYVANMVVGADLEIGKGLPALDIAYEAMVLKDVAYPFPEEWLSENSPCLKTNPNIMFIKQ